MPIDNDAIETKISALRVKSNDCRVLMSQIGTTISELTDICEHDDTQNPPNKLPIPDKGTGSTMTPARRQAVHDEHMAKADTYLA